MPELDVEDDVAPPIPELDVEELAPPPEPLDEVLDDELVVPPPPHAASAEITEQERRPRSRCARFIGR